MLNLKRILCATDFSESSEMAERYAVAISARYGARLTLLHVDPPNPLVAPYGEIPVDIRLFEQQRVDAELAMQRAHDRAAAASVKVEVRVMGGDPAREIVAAASSMDLVVIGTHGRSGVDRFMLGSVAEKVLRKTLSPVLVVPPAATTPPGNGVFSRVLCPIDGSAASAAAITAGLSLVRDTDGVLHLLEVVEIEPVVTQLDAVYGDAYAKAAYAQAAARLHAAVTADVRESCRIEEEVVQGKVSERIVAAADRTKTDIIVMGVRGRNALDMFTFGSATNDVVRRAACPVLVVHPPAVA